MLYRVILGIVCLYSLQADAYQYGHLQYLGADGVVRDITYLKRGGYAVVEGDILLKKIDSADTVIDNMPQAVILQRFGGGRWPNGVLPFKISEDFSSTCEYNIRAAIATWDENTQVKFLEITAENSARFADYANIIPSHSKVNSSYVGFQGGEQIIEISNSCKKMTIAHEIGHALGLWHEQSRTDRDQYIKIIWDNISSQHLFNFNQHVKDGKDVGEYDYDSVMHYSAYAFSKNGERTIVPLNEQAKIGQRSYLSEKDIAAVDYMYVLE